MIKRKMNALIRENICKELGISYRTLYNWENDMHVENNIKYIELLLMLGIDPKEQVETYRKNKKE